MEASLMLLEMISPRYDNFSATAPVTVNIDAAVSTSPIIFFLMHGSVIWITDNTVFVKGRRAADLFIPIVFVVPCVFPATTLNALEVASVYLPLVSESIGSRLPLLPDATRWPRSIRTGLR